MIRETFTAADMAVPFVAAPHGWHSQRDVPVVKKGRADVVFRPAPRSLGWPRNTVARSGASWGFLDPRVAADRVREVRSW